MCIRMTLIRVLSLLALSLALVACGGGDGALPTSSVGELRLLPQTVAGTLLYDDSRALTHLSEDDHVSVDDMQGDWPVASDGSFVCTELEDGDHTLHVHRQGRESIEIHCRILDGRGLDLGEVTIRDGRVIRMTGFDGYLAGFVDEDKDGINDHFADANGDGYCDEGKPLAGYPYMMNHGFADANHDGINDRYRDRDGDHANDIDGLHSAPAFGWVDEDQDGMHDLFRDADGDGICDMSGMPFGHHLGYADADGDGVNDHFRDANGDCVNDVTDEPYVCMPGWVDLDDDGRNDFFYDADGDGMHDDPQRPLAYAHGCGWIDEDGDRINDRFTDADGDGVNDEPGGPYARLGYHYGFRSEHMDADGDGIDDESGDPYCQGFGWVDVDADGVNDAYTDHEGDGINDRTGHRYDDGYMPDPGNHGHDGPRMGDGDWPRGRRGMGG